MEQFKLVLLAGTVTHSAAHFFYTIRDKMLIKVVINRNVAKILVSLPALNKLFYNMFDACLAQIQFVYSVLSYMYC